MIGSGVASNQRKSFHWPTTTFVMYEKQRQSQFKSSRRVSSLEENRIHPKHHRHHPMSKSATHLSTLAPRSRSNTPVVGPQHSNYLKVPDSKAHHFPYSKRIRSSSAPTEIEAISMRRSHSNDKETQERSDNDDIDDNDSKATSKHSTKKISLSRLPNFIFTKFFVHLDKNHTKAVTNPK